MLDLCKTLFPFNVLLQVFKIFFKFLSYTWLYHLSHTYLNHMQEKIQFI